jgi:predicted enzyme related to lactoylglutathione lyase
MDHVQHFEIPYKVRDRAKKFYFQAFGWQIFDVPGSPYAFVTTVPIEKNGMPKRAGAINGGLTPRTKQLTAPTVLVKVNDLKSHLTRIEHAGGTVVVPPTAMGPVWYARFRDPEGNVLGAIEDRPEGQEKALAVTKKATKGKASRAGKASKSKAKPAGPARKVTTRGIKPQRKAMATSKPRKAQAPREPQATWSR